MDRSIRVERAGWRAQVVSPPLDEQSDDQRGAAAEQGGSDVVADRETGVALKLRSLACWNKISATLEVSTPASGASFKRSDDVDELGDIIRGNG